MTDAGFIGTPARWLSRGRASPSAAMTSRLTASCGTLARASAAAMLAGRRWARAGVLASKPARTNPRGEGNRSRRMDEVGATELPLRVYRPPMPGFAGLGQGLLRYGRKPTYAQTQRRVIEVVARVVQRGIVGRAPALAQPQVG